MPEHIITQAETIDIGQRLFAGHPHLKLATRMIENTGVRKRHLIRPVDETLRDTDFGHRNQIFDQEAKTRVPPVIFAALDNARLTVADIDAIIFVTCSSYSMPSMTAWLINELGFRSDTTQIPIVQLGCAAGGAAINRGYDYCRANLGSHVLIVSCEFCSLLFQPADQAVGNLLSDGLFGDAIAAAVVRGDREVPGLLLQARRSHLIPHTEDWISYEVMSTGFHFRLYKGVPGAFRDAMPVLAKFTSDEGHDLPDLDFYAIHCGGPRILDALRDPGGVAPEALAMSMATLQDYGNIASASVFDVLRRIVAAGPQPGQIGLIAGFGPGITMELAIGTWQSGHRTTIS
ncbi:type III polyketide synthase [Amycolatopsis antarctica]|uniref:type III polyketide synthase n=1 Tax=Amycolatopsis antarctica TaxID=1854586 RepID=UPI001F0A1036|nr:type III polyketide synthase [Amycolatopsis antarctica]